MSKEENTIMVKVSVPAGLCQEALREAIELYSQRSVIELVRAQARNGDSPALEFLREESARIEKAKRDADNLQEYRTQLTLEGVKVLGSCIENLLREVDIPSLDLDGQSRWVYDDTLRYSNTSFIYRGVECKHNVPCGWYLYTFTGNHTLTIRTRFADEGLTAKNPKLPLEYAVQEKPKGPKVETHTFPTPEEALKYFVQRLPKHFWKLKS